MQGRRLKYLPCEGIGELNIGHKKSTFNASDRELLSRTWVPGGIEKHVCDIHHCCLMRSQSYKNKTKKKKKKKKNVVDENFPLSKMSKMTGNFCL